MPAQLGTIETGETSWLPRLVTFIKLYRRIHSQHHVQIHLVAGLLPSLGHECCTFVDIKDSVAMEVTLLLTGSQLRASDAKTDS